MSPQRDRDDHRDGDHHRGRGRHELPRPETWPAWRTRHAGGGERRQGHGGVVALRDDPDDPDRLGQALQVDLSSLDVTDAVDGSGQVDDLRARQDLPRPRLAAQAGRQVERAAPVSALHGHGLPGVQSDAHHEREGGVGQRLLDEPPLEIHGRADGLPGRSEDGEGLVPSQLDHRATPALHALPGELGELRGQLGGGLVPSLLSEQRVATHVRDQERPDLGCLAAA